MNLKNLVTKFRGQAKKQAVLGVPEKGIPSMKDTSEEHIEEVVKSKEEWDEHSKKIEAIQKI